MSRKKLSRIVLELERSKVSYYFLLSVNTVYIYLYSVKDLCKFLYRLLESEDPDHDDEFYHGRKATAEDKYPPGKCFDKKKISDI